MQKVNLPKVLNDLKIRTVKRSPEILTGIGIAGMITTTVMAVKATPKALVLIEREKNRVNHENLEEAKRSGCEECNQISHLEPLEIVKITWKCYIPAGITCFVSMACLIGASSVNLRRNSALAMAYTLSESTLRDYQKKVVETIGEKKEQTVRDAVAKEHVEKNPIENKEVIIVGRGDTLCFDTVSGRYFRSDIETIKKAENELYARLRTEMYISLNDFYYEIGLEPLRTIGDDLGWNIDRGFLDLSFSSQLATDGTPCLVIDYGVAPRYDYRNLM